MNVIIGEMKNKIIIKGARENNLKNISLEIPKNQLVIMTGPSGSGKTSLAFDTIYAEGQRRYIESLSSYARQFLGGLEKPDVDSIEGLNPAISIDQKTTANNPRSTVGTITEIYDYLRLLYARCGKAYCPNHNIEISASSISSIIDKIVTKAIGSRIEILSRLVENKKGSFKDLILRLKNDGYIRAYIDNNLCLLEEVESLNKNTKHNIDVVIDRLILKTDDIRKRLHDSIEVALKLSNDSVLIKCGDELELFSTKHACPYCNFSIAEIEPRLFSFNSPLGACDNCKGLGFKNSVSYELLIPDDNLSINKGALRFFKNTLNSTNLDWQEFDYLLSYYKIDKDKALKEFSDEELDIILNGSKELIEFNLTSVNGTKIHRRKYIEGVKSLIQRRYEETSSMSAKEYYQSYMMEEMCEKCQGARLNDLALCVKIKGLNIEELCRYSIKEAANFFKDLHFDDNRQEIAKLLLKEINNRLNFLVDVGLSYLSLNRLAASLSGGEAQRIRLATQIGSALSGVLYVLDEPSIGLHQSDNDKLIATLKKMRDLGNSLIVVEHDEDTMLASDYIIDIGPYAGKLGGEVMAMGTPEEVMANPNSLTGAYLSKRRYIDYPKKRLKPSKNVLHIQGAYANNLRNLDVKIPLNLFVAVSGVSGSGKSSLINEVLSKTIQRELYNSKIKAPKVKKISGIEKLDKLIVVSQDPIGRTPRSNPATYTGVFDDIRELFANTNEASIKGYDKGRFSFNVKGGRCEACNGDGLKRISMLFVPDVYVECEVCKGKRYNEATLEVKYKGKNIYDVLNMSVDTALEFFENIPRIYNKLAILKDVGLGYIELGQSAPSLSGGEAQRVKLAYELQKKATGKTLFILDEPTTGLHSYDVDKLIKVLRRIVTNGDSIIVIEHNLDVLKNADYLIDLGPLGGDEGGMIIAKGTPEKVSENENSLTGKYLKKVL